MRLVMSAAALLVAGMAALRVAHALDPACYAKTDTTVVDATASGQVVYLPNAGLPELAPDTLKESYGPSQGCAGKFDGIITVAGPSQLRQSDQYYSAGIAAKQAQIMFMEWLNNVRGGLQVGNKTYGMRLHFVGSGAHCSTCVESARATAHAIRMSQADFVVSEFSSLRVKWISYQTNVLNKILMSWGSTSTAVHTQNNLTFGTCKSATIICRCL